MFSPASRLPEYVSLPALVVLGLGGRLLLAYVVLPDSGFWEDVKVYGDWARTLAAVGPRGFYAAAGFADYPPAFLFLLWLLGVLAAHLAPGDPAAVERLVKLPAILADAGIAVVSYCAIRPAQGPKLALLAAGLFLLHPLSWFDSAIWGQSDAVGSLLVLAALMALTGGRWELAASLATLAVLTKPQYGIILPLILTVLVRRHLLDVGSGPQPRSLLQPGPSRLLTSALATVATAAVVLVSFDLSPGQLVALLQGTAGGYPFATVNAFNLWAIYSFGLGVEGTDVWEAVPYRLDTEPLLLGLSPSILGIILLAITVVWVLWQLLRHDDRATLFGAACLLVLALFVLPTRIHERYAYPILVLGLPLAFAARRWLVVYGVLTLGSFYNVYALYTLPAMANPGVQRPELLDPFFSPLAIVAMSGVQVLGLLWMLRELPLLHELTPEK